MCGIAGCFEFDTDRSVDREALERMTRFMEHRGPDGQGLAFDQTMGLGHRRLSIIDLELGAQPMWSECGRYCICFNGEIYNYIELRDQLEARGRTFQTHSDTEVLLYAMVDLGPKVLPSLNGMFAFALWDREARRMLLARDHLGIKPLYYYHDGERLMFASDVGAMACHPRFPRRLNQKALSHFFTWRVVPNPYTVYQDTWQLLPGHYLEVSQEGRLSTHQFWDIPVQVDTGRPDPQRLEDELSGLLEDALRLQVRSDVPVGAFLSGGVDSSTIAYWMAKAVDRPITFTIGFGGEDKEFDESEWARDVAHNIGTEHHLHVLRHYSMEPLLDRISHFFNHPCGTGVPNYFVSALARKHVTVALAGVGGDELFAGYGRFQAALDPRRLGIATNDPIHAFLRSLVSYTEKDKMAMFQGDFYAGVEDEPSLEYIREQSAHIPEGEMINKLCYIDLKHFMLNDLLFNLDKMSMAHSLEVRVPLLDYRLVEFAMTVPPALKIRKDNQKLLLKRAMFRRLPEHVFLRRKRGFSLPKQLWAPRMEPFIRELVNKQSVEQRGVFAWDAVSPFLDNLFEQGRVSWRDANNIWNIFSFELWARKFLDRAPELTAPAADGLQMEEVR